MLQKNYNCQFLHFVWVGSPRQCSLLLRNWNVLLAVRHFRHFRSTQYLTTSSVKITCFGKSQLTCHVTVSWGPCRENSSLAGAVINPHSAPCITSYLPIWYGAQYITSHRMKRVCRGIILYYKALLLAIN